MPVVFMENSSRCAWNTNLQFFSSRVLDVMAHIKKKRMQESKWTLPTLVYQSFWYSNKDRPAASLDACAQALKPLGLDNNQQPHRKINAHYCGITQCDQKLLHLWNTNCWKKEFQNWTTDESWAATKFRRFLFCRCL